MFTAMESRACWALLKRSIMGSYHHIRVKHLSRYVEFLYSKNRLNVAVSRAQCLAVIVANTKLLEIPCGTMEQMKLVNTFCWLDEYAAGGASHV